MNGRIVIKKGREKPLIQQHPWVFSGAISHAENAAPGDIVTLESHTGAFLARGYWNPTSQIQVRILTWRDEEVNDAWWRRMIERAVSARGIKNVAYTHGDNPHLAYRLINAENDFLPGLVVDRYSHWLVMQALTLGIDQRKQQIAALLAELTPTQGIYERSDVDVRGKEGLRASTGPLWGQPPPEHILIDEQGVQIYVDVRSGHKTGFYLDQAPSRALLHRLLTEDFVGVCRLLNLFSYTGGFGLHALQAGGCHAVNVDASGEALRLAELNMQLNNFHLNTAVQTYECVQMDAFDYLRKALSAGEQFDIIICDPPKFAHSAQQVEKAARGYKDLNLHAFKLLKPGGYLMTFSCSGAVSADLFQKIVFGALADSGRQAQILQHLQAGEDHPTALTFPEGAYLKGLLLRVY